MEKTAVQDGPSRAPLENTTNISKVLIRDDSDVHGEHWDWFGGSVTEVSDLKTDDFCELEVRGVKPFYLMKLKRWSETGVPTELHSVIHTDTLSLTNENSSSRV